MFEVMYDEPDQVPLSTSLTGDGTPIGPLLWTVFASILEVFILCFAGWILARRGIIDKKTQKQLNRINVSLFTPSLLFSKVAFSLSPQKLKELWIIPIFFVVVTGVSAGVAWAMGYLLGLKRTQRNFAIAASMFNNSNSLPIALMQSLVITVHGLKWGKDDNKDAMIGRALTYLVLYSTLGMMVRWSYGVHLLSQADDEVVPEIDIVEPVDEEETEQDLRRSRKPSVQFHLGGESERRAFIPDSVSEGSTASVLDLAEEPLHTLTAPPRVNSSLKANGDKPDIPLPKNHSGFFYSFPNTPNRSRADLTTFATNTNANTPSASGSRAGSPNPEADLSDEWGGVRVLPVTAPPSTKWESLYRRARTRVKRFWKKFNAFMTVPMWAATASLLVACIKPVQHALENHMQPVKGSLVAAGNCSIPVTLVVLGAYFYTPPEKNSADMLPSAMSNSNGVSKNGHSRIGNGTTASSPDLRNLTARNRDSRGSEMSVATLRESLKDAFRMRSVNKANGSATGGSSSPRKGEGKTVFVAIMARMILTPALILPAMAALALFDLHKVMEDPVFVVSMVLLVSSPPALTLAQITQAASGDAFERLISKTIFWSYCIFTPPLTIVYVVLGLLLSKL
ncbi:hypothetical protein FRB96_005254 [Tulasnella sp. 330]|nr:hypothetical protein FRB96_005254 [Tulasnella sp. 330]KAG8871917.1 hypothetical protein FRB97_008213 [Tulasnella sp. 331]